MTYDVIMLMSSLLHSNILIQPEFKNLFFLLKKYK